MSTYMCVGGPKHGERVAVPRGMHSWIIDCSDVWVGASWNKVTPESIVPFERAVYKVERLNLHETDEAHLSIKVLAYYGRDRKDRPEGWYL